MGNLGFSTPFRDDIMRALTALKVKVPPIDHYDGTTDPIDHLAALKGLALTWFTELPSGNISSFTALEAAFKQNFIVERRHQKTSIHLMSIRQRREEDLADYIKRFNEESLKDFDLLDSVAFTALMSGLYPSSRFKLKLVESEASSFSETMNLAQKFIQASDISNTHEEPSSGKRKHEYTPRADNPRHVPRKEKDKKLRLENNWNDPRATKMALADYRMECLSPLSGPLVIADTLGGRKSSTKATKTKEQSKKDKYLFKRRDEAVELNAKRSIQGDASSSLSSTIEDGASNTAAAAYVLQKRDLADSNNELSGSPTRDQVATSVHVGSAKEAPTAGKEFFLMCRK
ncbi:uncharacterized protein LOC130591836 [Beta vulgaris subsp. vulgaris]|uniref:uncharacterized protein LOC130591836 n=1 Tax=Beta vulgaris subsp. vulgaris TaxID=3555 RepID=UPI00254976AC|nr:uncharacterized protein LOC130591836 [Beta vulgaris subsp. vulgaris]